MRQQSSTLTIGAIEAVVLRFAHTAPTKLPCYAPPYDRPLMAAAIAHVNQVGHVLLAALGSNLGVHNLRAGLLRQGALVNAIGGRGRCTV